jgi:predicted amidohydrolase YtcJ
MLAPYEPDPGRGEPPGGPLGVHVTAPDEVRRIVARAADHGIAAQVHGIGDAAVRTSLDALEATVGRTPLMPRIEHAQLVDPADMGRFAGAGIAACVQPRDIRADADNAWRFWGARRVEHGAYAYGSLAHSGAVVIFGTDAPVESPDPWPAIASAVTRRDPTRAGAAPFVPGEAMILGRALRAACLDAAISAGEDDRGRLVPGQRADLIVVPAAAFDEPVDAYGPLETARPDVVVVDGEVVLER